MLDVNSNNTLVELRESNLYLNGKIVEYNDGTIELLRNKIKWTGRDNDEYYTVRNSDDLDKIAWKMYSNIVEKAEWYWWVIADANDIENPLDLSEYIGNEIVVPNLSVFLLIAEKKG